MTSEILVHASVNGVDARFLAEGSETLLAALRNSIGLTGVKEGCGTGDCGACSVLLNDRLVCACLVLAAEATDARIVTVEGLAEPGALHPLQNAFLELAALQCGICTPGLLIAAKALLDQNRDPKEDEIRYAIAGNLCRCTGYDKVVRAIQHAAGQLHPDSENE